uniref:Uncharacterized protein n=1 Tax=Dunaliella tertiolecta TaxID=3047 RepID=A0A7S3QKI2_DUNTE
MMLKTPTTTSVKPCAVRRIQPIRVQNLLRASASPSEHQPPGHTNPGVQGSSSAGGCGSAMAGASSISREDISSAFAMQANTEGEKVLSISDLLASCPEDGVWEDDPTDSWMRS